METNSFPETARKLVEAITGPKGPRACILGQDFDGNAHIESMLFSADDGIDLSILRVHAPHSGNDDIVVETFVLDPEKMILSQVSVETYQTHWIG